MARMTREERAAGKRQSTADPTEGLAARLARAEQHMPSEEDEEQPTEDLTAEEDADDEVEMEPMPEDSSTVSVLDDETEWTADFPAETEAEATARAATTLSYRDVEEADVDRLWDWVRADEDKGLRFLGITPSTSAEMRERLELYASLVAIDEGGVHVGFGGFGPVTTIYVLIHLYLSTAVRGDLRRLAPAFIEESQRRYPGTKLSTVALTPAEVRLYCSFGFTVKHMLTLDPPAAEPLV